MEYIHPHMQGEWGNIFTVHVIWEEWPKMNMVWLISLWTLFEHQIGIFTAVIISGGTGGSSSSVEVFLPFVTGTCSFPSLPDAIYTHTINTLGNTPVICGGSCASRGMWAPCEYSTSCLHFTGGTWTNYTTLLERRGSHVSWVSSAGLVLMGGIKVNGRGIDTTEMVPDGVESFGLVRDIR